MDEQDRLHFSGVPGHAGASGEIALQTQFEKDGGDLERIFGAVPIPRLLEYLPKHQSAFDAMLPAIRDAWMINDYVDLWQFDEELAGNHFAWAYTMSTVKLILDIGISKSNKNEMRWAAARGPWPAQGNLRDDQLLPCMQCVYGKLRELLHLVVTSSSTLGARKEMQYTFASTDMQCYLSRAWNDLDGWRT